MNWLAVLAGGLCLAGSLLPWMELSPAATGTFADFSRSVPGVEELPGQLVAALSILIMGIALWRGTAARLAPLLVGVLIALLAWSWLDTVASWQYLHVLSQGDAEPTPVASVGVGYRFIAAGVGLLFLSTALLAARAAVARWRSGATAT